jgi:quinohemoprotein ethanol dehydrogenase
MQIARGIVATMVALLVVSAAPPSARAASQTVHNDPMFTDEADANWPSFGRTYDEDHHSPLTQINDRNIAGLKLAWFIDLPIMISASGPPLAVDGVLYFAVGLSVVYAADAATGKILWTYDPKVTEATNEKLKLAWGIRGLAYAEHRIFVGTQDGRLLALSAKNGKLLWSVETTEGEEDGRYITGAPRVFNGKVIIGHGGADFGPVRGYVTAYDAASGRQLWRFYTVPGDPAKGFENKAMEMASRTWKGEYWKFGGGGTVWHAITFDPKYNRIYLGTGNGAPWNYKIRSPGGGDNLFLCSIVALDADTGEYVWHYQTTPGESWDYNSAMDMQLATLTIDGEPKDVILHAPKNGFFYVIDRATGKLISAEPFAKVTWAKYVDKNSGRPVENPEARFPNGQAAIFPGAGGAHNWLSAAYSPQTKLIYIPVNYISGYYDARGVNVQTWTYTPHAFNSGFVTIFRKEGALPVPPRDSNQPLAELQARDPVHQKVVWSTPFDVVNTGGAMSTSGNLVFLGQATGELRAYAADSGKLLWSFQTQNGITSEPITYLAGGKQYITIISAYGGLPTIGGEASAKLGWGYRTQRRRVLSFALGGTATLPQKPASEPVKLLDDGSPIDQERFAAGQHQYELRCLACHGFGAISGGAAPDLRASSALVSREAFQQVVHGGLLKHSGMPRFDDLSLDDVEALRTYVRGESRRALGTSRGASQ